LRRRGERRRDRAATQNRGNRRRPRYRPDPEKPLTAKFERSFLALSVGITPEARSAHRFWFLCFCREVAPRRGQRIGLKPLVYLPSRLARSALFVQLVWSFRETVASPSTVGVWAFAPRRGQRIGFSVLPVGGPEARSAHRVRFLWDSFEARSAHRLWNFAISSDKALAPQAGEISGHLNRERVCLRWWDQ